MNRTKLLKPTQKAVYGSIFLWPFHGKFDSFSAKYLKTLLLLSRYSHESINFKGWTIWMCNTISGPCLNATCIICCNSCHTWVFLSLMVTAARMTHISGPPTEHFLSAYNEGQCKYICVTYRHMWRDRKKVGYFLRCSCTRNVTRVENEQEQTHSSFLKHQEVTSFLTWYNNNKNKKRLTEVRLSYRLPRNRAEIGSV